MPVVYFREVVIASRQIWKFLDVCCICCEAHGICAPNSDRDYYAEGFREVFCDDYYYARARAASSDGDHAGAELSGTRGQGRVTCAKYPDMPVVTKKAGLEEQIAPSLGARVGQGANAYVHQGPNLNKGTRKCPACRASL